VVLRTYQVNGQGYEKPIEKFERSLFSQLTVLKEINILIKRAYFV
jgi:hypothetical protein